MQTRAWQLPPRSRWYDHCSLPALNSDSDPDICADMIYVGNIGECKDVMVKYLSCIKKVMGTNDPECRDLAKSYLSCRMDRCVLRTS